MVADNATIADPRRDVATDALRVPPHSIEAEQSVLGGLMLDNEAWLQVAERVTEGDFYRRDHNEIYRAIEALADAGKPYDVVTLAEWLQNQELLESVGGLQYLAELTENTPSAANIAAYADIVRERSVLRSLVRAGTDIADSGYRTEGRSADELLDQAERFVFEIAERETRTKGGFRRMKDLLVDALDRIDQLFQFIRRQHQHATTGHPFQRHEQSGLLSAWRPISKKLWAGLGVVSGLEGDAVNYEPILRTTTTFRGPRVSPDVNGHGFTKLAECGAHIVRIESTGEEDITEKTVGGP